LKFITYWELNPDKDPKELAGLATKLSKEGKWPLPGIKVIAWYVSVNIPMWGVSVIEAESVEQVYRSLLTWIKEIPSFFKTYKVSPALSTKDAVQIMFE